MSFSSPSLAPSSSTTLISTNPPQPTDSLPWNRDPKPSDQTKSQNPDTFPFPPHHAYPPLYTLQPNLTTRTRQLHLWRDLLLSYCTHHRIYRLVVIDAIQSPLFNNQKIGKRLSLKDLREILSWVCGKEGGERAEWIGGDGKGKEGEVWVYWKRPEEWSRALEEWVDGTGQRGTVLTVYELLEGEGSVGEGTFENLCLGEGEIWSVRANEVYRIPWHGLGAAAESTGGVG
jgi:ESCRT-II complex subunit VPS25